VALDEHLGDYLPENLVFMATDSSRVKLSDMISRPTVISPVYYNCPGLCTPIMDGLVKLLNRTDLVVGKDFDVINISFHENESPELAAIKKGNYMELVDDQDAGDHWHFMTGDRENIRSLLGSLGYSVIMRGEDILHPAAIMIVSPTGKIVKYIHGTKYNPIEFKMAVKEGGNEKTMPTITKVIKMCFNYEPDGRGRQKKVTILGFITMLGFALILMISYPPLRNKK
jgi:protein SCO1/2